ncbi:MAG TPA: hypothetical protein VH877_05280 [Polyangia bacterium]|jgi:hypothetical protein|nr:hypothetical protein [Polyangia bacterium]
MTHARWTLRPLVFLVMNLAVVVGVLALTSTSAVASHSEKSKADKTPVMFGSWKGPGASGFKSALRHGIAKECAVVGAKAARAVIDGEVRPQGKGVVVRVIVKSAKGGEVVEQREFTFARPRASQSQVTRMGRAVSDMARRAPM